jgi:hypothetical protein
VVERGLVEESGLTRTGGAPPLSPGDRAFTASSVALPRGIPTPLPQLLLAPEGSDVEEVVGTNGRRCSGSQIQEIAQVLLESTRSRIAPAEPLPQMYSWERLASVYDELLMDAASRKSPTKAVSPAPWARSIWGLV